MLEKKELISLGYVEDSLDQSRKGASSLDGLHCLSRCVVSACLCVPSKDSCLVRITPREEKRRSCSVVIVDADGDRALAVGVSDRCSHPMGLTRIERERDAERDGNE